MRGCEKDGKGRKAAKGRKGRRECRSPPFPLVFPVCVRPLAVRSAVRFRSLRSFLAFPSLRCAFPWLCCAFPLRSAFGRPFLCASFAFVLAFALHSARKGKEGHRAQHRNEPRPRGKAEATLAGTERGGRGGGEPSLCTFVWPTGGTPLRHFVHSFTLQGGAITSFRSFVPLVLPGGLLVFLLSFPFRPACSSVFLVSFQERSSAWKW